MGDEDEYSAPVVQNLGVRSVSEAMALRHERLHVAVIVTALLLVPPLLRATQHFDNGSASSLNRLNRGFAVFETTCQALPPPHRCTG
jgi:hypothetical protein